MMAPKLEAEICAYLHQLPRDQQRHVLDFVHALVISLVRGVSGQALLRCAGAIDASDLATMTQAIAEGCEQIHGEELIRND